MQASLRAMIWVKATSETESFLVHIQQKRMKTFPESWNIRSFVRPKGTNMDHAPNYEQIIFARGLHDQLGLSWCSCSSVTGKDVRITLAGLYKSGVIYRAMVRICFSESCGLHQMGWKLNKINVLLWWQKEVDGTGKYYYCFQILTKVYFPTKWSIKNGRKELWPITSKCLVK